MTVECGKEEREGRCECVIRKSAVWKNSWTAISTKRSVIEWRRKSRSSCVEELNESTKGLREVPSSYQRM